MFWREFRRSFTSTGAVLPSGPALAVALSRHVGGDAADGRPAKRVLEVGPGTGAVTRHIVAAMQSADTLDLVERNAEFVRCLADRLASDDHYRAAAARIRLHHASIEELSEAEPFDVIISGLPLNNFPVELVEQILAKLRRLLAPSGTLSFFEYVAIRRAKGMVARQAERDRLRRIGAALELLLGEHEIGRDCVWANVPPAWVHHVRIG